MAKSKLKEKPKWQDIVHIQINKQPIEDLLDQTPKHLANSAVNCIRVSICEKESQIDFNEKSYFEIDDISTICKGNILTLADLSGGYCINTKSFENLLKKYEVSIETLEQYVWNTITKLYYAIHPQVQAIVLAIKDYPLEMLNGLELDTRWRLLREYTSVDDTDVQIKIYLHKRGVI